jgi:hypothetical protein
VSRFARRALLLIGFALFLCPGAWAEVRVSGLLDRPSVEVGDSAILSITIEGATSLDGDPRLPFPEGLRVRDAGESRNFSLVNGKFSQSIQRQYVIAGLRPGTYTIGPADVRASGRAYRVGPFTLTVVPSSGTAPIPPPPAGQGLRPRPGQGGGGDADISTGGMPPIAVEMRADPPEVFLGQQTLLRVTFLRRADIAVVDARFLPPSTEGFWKEDLPPERQSSRQRGDVPYQATEIVMALFPTRTGDLTVSPASVEVQYRDPRGRGMSDPFGFFGFGGRAREAQPTSAPCVIRVRPLPPGAPPGFTGAVGRFSIDGKLDRQETVQGEPVTWTLEIEGEGNVASAEGPRFPDVPGCRSYDAGNEVNTTRDQDRIGGSKRYSRVLVPEAAGSLDLPRIQWAFFDPQAGVYRTAEVPARRITVAPSESAGGSGSTGRLGGAIRGIRKGGRLAALTSERPWTRFPFWMLQALPVFALVSGFLLKRRREGILNDPEGTRMRQAPRKLRESLRQVGSDPSDPWGRLARALEGFLADRFGPEVRGLTRQGLAAHLAACGVAADLAERVASLLEEADSLRYAPGSSAAKQEISRAVREAADCAARLHGGSRA